MEFYLFQVQGERVIPAVGDARGHYISLTDDYEYGHFARCDEFGKAEWLPREILHFQFIDEETKNAFKGDTEIQCTEEIAIVRFERENNES